jgi:uncharacterized membrane protein
MDAFDLRSLLLARHAQHVVIVHFPIALTIASGVFDGLAASTGRRALATGVLAWQWLLGGTPLRGVLLLHLLGATASATSIAVMWGLRWNRRRRGELSLGRWYVALAIVAMAAIALTGHLGGVLSGVTEPAV